MKVVYDIETLINCFTYIGINIETGEIYQFVLHKNRDDLKLLIEHLNKCKQQIGFNNLNFDYPVIHFILKNYKQWNNIEEAISKIYNESQRIIEVSNKKIFGTFAAIYYKEVIIPQVDLFKIWHYDNKARMTSLKALEISMNYPNVMDMPINHKEEVIYEQIPLVLEYNKNDVLATKEFYNRSLAKIELRKSLQQKFKIPCINWSDSKIGEELILKLYCDKTGKNPWETKKLRSERLKIALKEIILPYIKFTSKEFNELLEYFKNLEITETKGSIDKSIKYKGFIYEYGSGGIHGCIKSGVYESNEDYIIIDADVSSLYPSLSIENSLFIEHLGHEFVDIYQSIVDMRIEAKKAGNNVLSDGFKLASNSVYGKSNDKYSFLYDPKFTMSITINGQLLLTMLAESLVNQLGEYIQVLQVNTDGITVRLHKSCVEDYYNLCKIWQSITNLQLEYVEYLKMWIGDVNNYGALTKEGKIKNKGRFEVEKVVGSEVAYHKDNSFKIVPLAIQEYFVNNIPIEETIYSHKNIYDFCGRQKFKGKDYGAIHYIKDGEELIEKQQKNTRYYISNSGKSFIKYYGKGTTEKIHNGYQVEIFNKYIEKNDYNIDYSFYIKEVQKEIDNLESKQLNLF